MGLLGLTMLPGSLRWKEHLAGMSRGAAGMGKAAAWRPPPQLLEAGMGALPGAGIGALKHYLEVRDRKKRGDPEPSAAGDVLAGTAVGALLGMMAGGASRRLAARGVESQVRRAIEGSDTANPRLAEFRDWLQKRIKPDEAILSQRRQGVDAALAAHQGVLGEQREIRGLIRDVEQSSKYLQRLRDQRQAILAAYSTDPSTQVMRLEQIDDRIRAGKETGRLAFQRMQQTAQRRGLPGLNPTKWEQEFEDRLRDPKTQLEALRKEEASARKRLEDVAFPVLGVPRPDAKPPFARGAGKDGKSKPGTLEQVLRDYARRRHAGFFGRPIEPGVEDTPLILRDAE